MYSRYFQVAQDKLSVINSWNHAKFLGAVLSYNKSFLDFECLPSLLSTVPVNTQFRRKAFHNLYVTRKFSIPEPIGGMAYASFQPVWVKNETLVRTQKLKGLAVPINARVLSSAPLQTFRAIFLWLLKTVFLNADLLYPPAIERTETSLARFPAKNISNMEPDLFHWPIRILKSEWRRLCFFFCVLARPTKSRESCSPPLNIGNL